MRLKHRTLGMTALCIVLLFAAACSDWERSTFQSLAASKAVLDQAQTDYETGAIAKTAASYTLINKGKDVQKTAVDGLLAYEQVKAAKGSQSALQAQQQIVAAALAQLPAILGDIKALKGGTQ